MLRAVAPAAAAVLLVRAARRAGAASRASGLEGDRPARRIPAPIDAALRSALVRADLPWSPADAVVAWATAIGVAVILGAALGGGYAAVAGLLVGITSLPAIVWSLRHRRDARVRAALPDVLDDVARDLATGGTVARAVERLAQRPGVVGDEARAIRRRTTLGLGLDEALAGWARDHAGARVERPAGSAAAGLRIAVASGGRAAAPLHGLAAAMRDEDHAAAEARSQAAQARLSAALLGFLPLASLVFSAVFDAATVAVLVHRPAGRVCLVAGLALEAMGLAWMRRIVRVTP